MRLLITISLLIPLFLSAQVTYKWRYYSKDLGGGKTGYFLVGMPSDSASNSNKRPTFCFEPGSGETGGSGKMSQANALMYFVPTLYNSKWSGGVKQGTPYGDSTVYPVYIVAQYDYSATSLPSETKLRWDAVWADYSSYIDTDQIHFGGISLGGLTTLAMVTGRQGLTSATGNLNAGYKAGENVNGGSRNIILGYDIDLPTTGGSNQLNVGNAIFGTGINQAGTTMGGKIGIKVKTPQADFHVGGNIKIDTIPTGTPGTDSILVTDGGVVKRIPANYYSTGGVKNNVAYIDDANYTFADTISAAVLNNSTANRTFTLPSEVTFHGRTITIRNDAKDTVFVSSGFVYNKTWGSAVIAPHRWVTATADRNSGWIVIAQGGTSSNSTGWYVPSISSVQTLDSATPDTFYYTKNAELIHVWGRATVVTKSSDSFTSQPVDITLPFAWDALDGAMFTDDGQLVGFASVNKSGTKQFVDMVPNSVTNKATLSFTKTPNTLETFNIRVSFNYRVIGGLIND